MKASDIRNAASLSCDDVNSTQGYQVQQSKAVAYLMQAAWEIAAQLAEANEHLVKIANLLPTVSAPKWVWFKYNTFKYIVDAREVASISAPNDHQCVIIMRNEGGSDPGRWCDGSFEEVCAKLGIPTEA